ncbi:MAG: ABC transporter substrate binding protein [Bradyrhizobium sp.]
MSNMDRASLGGQRKYEVAFRSVIGVTELAISHRLPSMLIFRAYPEAGGLMSYGGDYVALYRQSANYVAKLLQGANPADLPIELPIKFELAVNLKTAKALNNE